MSYLLNTAIIVPARLDSARFPRKLLHPIQGQPLILHTARRLRALAPEVPLFFAVDGPELATTLEAAGYATILTDPALPSGTDRLAAANKAVRARRVINIQADEPLCHLEHIQLLNSLLDEDAPMATLGCRFASADEFADPSRVKALLARDGHALTFSRAPIPYRRDHHGAADPQWLAQAPVLLHLGMYAYHAEFLATFCSLAPTPIEQAERLEQLRALEHGFRIRIAETSYRTHGIDTLADVAHVEAQLTTG